MADEVTARRDVKIVVVHAGDEIVIEYPASIRMGRRALLDALLPIDDAVPIDAAWMDAVGDDPRGDRMWVWPIPGAGAAVRVWASRDPAGPAWRCQVEDTGDECERESVVLPQLTTRGQLRRLLAALGVPAVKGGAPCPE